MALQLLFLWVACASGTHSVGGDLDRGRGNSFLAAQMRPEVVARTLLAVETEWKAQVAMFAECQTAKTESELSTLDCSGAPRAFQRSCKKIAMAVVQGASGNRAVVQEYMGDVCKQPVLSGWQRSNCAMLAEAIHKEMSDDTYSNRLNFHGELCQQFWSTFRVEKDEAPVVDAVSRNASAVMPPTTATAVAEEKPGPVEEKTLQAASDTRSMNNSSRTAVPKVEMTKAVRAAGVHFVKAVQHEARAVADSVESAFGRISARVKATTEECPDCGGAPVNASSYGGRKVVDSIKYALHRFAAPMRSFFRMDQAEKVKQSQSTESRSQAPKVDSAKLTPDEFEAAMESADGEKGDTGGNEQASSRKLVLAATGVQ